MEAAQGESEERFRNLADSVPALIRMADAGGQCIYVNRPWLAYTGRTMIQEFGRGFAESIHPDDLARVLADETAAIERRAGADDGIPAPRRAGRLPVVPRERGAALQRQRRLHRPDRHPDRRDRAAAGRGSGPRRRSRPSDREPAFVTRRRA